MSRLEIGLPNTAEIRGNVGFRISASIQSLNVENMPDTEEAWTPIQINTWSIYLFSLILSMFGHRTSQSSPLFPSCRSIHPSSSSFFWLFTHLSLSVILLFLRFHCLFFCLILWAANFVFKFSLIFYLFLIQLICFPPLI